MGLVNHVSKRAVWVLEPTSWKNLVGSFRVRSLARLYFPGGERWLLFTKEGSELDVLNHGTDKTWGLMRGAVDDGFQWKCIASGATASMFEVNVLLTHASNETEADLSEILVWLQAALELHEVPLGNASEES